MQTFAWGKWRILAYLFFLVLICLYLGMQLVASSVAFNYVDLPSWGDDWNRFLCAMSSGEACSPLSKFPIAYLFNSFLSNSAWFNLNQFSLLAINIAFVLFSIYFLYIISESSKRNVIAVAYVCGLIFSVIPPFYIYSGALELQYGVVLGTFIVCLYVVFIKKVHSRFALLFLFVSSILLPFYKDISILFIGVLYIAAIVMATKSVSLRLSADVVWKNRYVSITILVAVMLAMILVLIYNSFRYGTFIPVSYISEAREASPNFRTKLGHIFWIFFSPNGGFFVSWAASFLVMLVTLKVNKLRPSKFGIVACVLVISLFSIILANWWTPFGWEGWGNRLILPSAIAGLMVLGATSVSSPEIEESAAGFFGGIFRSVGIFFVSICFLVSFSYVWISYSPNRYQYLEYSLWGSDACKAVGQLRDKRPMWEFKKSTIHLKCHQDRFAYVPGTPRDMSPLSIVGNGKYIIGGGNGAGVVGEGWSAVEEWGVWSDGSKAEIRFIPSQKFSKISIDLSPFVYGSVVSQRVIVFINGKIVVDDNLESPKVVEINISDDGLFDPDAIFTLEFNLPNATSPMKLGMNSDTRLLAIGLRSIEFSK